MYRNNIENATVEKYINLYKQKISWALNIWYSSLFLLIRYGRIFENLLVKCIPICNKIRDVRSTVKETPFHAKENIQEVKYIAFK